MSVHETHTHTHTHHTHTHTHTHRQAPTYTPTHTPTHIPCRRAQVAFHKAQEKCVNNWWFGGQMMIYYITKDIFCSFLTQWHSNIMKTWYNGYSYVKEDFKTKILLYAFSTGAEVLLLRPKHIVVTTFNSISSTCPSLHSVFPIKLVSMHLST